MRVALDASILVSSLLSPLGKRAKIYRAWYKGHFGLLTSEEQLVELRATLRKPAIATLIKPYKAGRLVNQIRELAEVIDPLPRVERSPDPSDNFLLSMREAGDAGYPVTGDKRGLLLLQKHGKTKIVSAKNS